MLIYDLTNYQENADLSISPPTAGKTEIVIHNSLVSDKPIYLTPLNGKENSVVRVTAKKSGEYFKAGLDSPLEEDLEFKWVIVK